jgi:excinuclease UvrABC ATPase subunit
MTEYRYNKETGGICTIEEFMQHWEPCSKCNKARICEEVIKQHFEELNNENCNRSPIQEPKRVYTDRTRKQIRSSQHQKPRNRHC